MPDLIRVPLECRTGAWSSRRQGEPISVGIPLPLGLAASIADIGLTRQGGGAVPIQVRALDRWPDRSIRWALLDFAADADAAREFGYALQVGPQTEVLSDVSLRVTAGPSLVEVSTGPATFTFAVGGSFPFSQVTVGGSQSIDAARSGFQIEHNGIRLSYEVSEVRVLDEGPLRAELEIRGIAKSAAALPVEVFTRVEVFAGTATARLDLCIRNTRRASHPSGEWPLGDPGSVLLSSAALKLHINGTVARVCCAPESGTPFSEVQQPFEIFQESSGGDRWNGPIHKNRDGEVRLRFRGYEWRSGIDVRSGNRASPIVSVATASGLKVTVALPQFWENFPKAIAVNESTIEIGLFPRGSADVHELQGGEQKSHQIVVAFAEDLVSDLPLAWVHEPLFVHASPTWLCGSGAVPFLTPATKDDDGDYSTLVNLSLDPVDGFVAKREVADEYGWRNFGDLYADHESARQPPDQPLVSHYNNQYDAIAGFALHFLRTGDPRWWRLMTDLARHIRDIDIYHTVEDKPAYNGGLFWHTAHYTDAGTATHRTYPRGGGEGGGPSPEHNYNLGLMLHYFLTGDRASSATAIGMARWVLDMDDGRLTPFRWLAGGPTGVASATGSVTYHGPGRAPANSILACLVAHQLTGDAVYTGKANELIRRCIHPEDDLDVLNLLDVERRWYYTVFLQALGVYLHQKSERNEIDEMFAYGQASLLHYARWMVAHERPYLDHPEQLEFPNETWAAQDLRKADVFVWAASHVDNVEYATFVERATFFFRYSVEKLSVMPGRRFTRPLALVLSNGVRHAWFLKPGSSPNRLLVAALPQGSSPTVFRPQKAKAIRRVKWLLTLAGVLILVAVWTFR